MDSTKIKIKKLDAAKRQLDMAIELWFSGGDDVAVHTLAAAAYQIIHDINEFRNTGHAKLFNAPAINPEFHKMWNQLVRNPVNFFKHADKDPDPDGEIEFNTGANLMYLIFGISGLGYIQSLSSDQERILYLWLRFHEPSLIVKNAELDRKFEESSTARERAYMSSLSKEEFFKVGMEALANLRRLGIGGMPGGNP